MKRTILLAGATGFVGSFVLEQLVQDGHTVVVLKRSTSDTWRIERWLKQITTYNSDQVELAAIFSDHQFTDVMNLVTDYGRGQDSSLAQLMRTNVDFSIALVEAAIAHQVDRYWNTDSYWNTNASLEDSITPYAYTKKVLLDRLREQYAGHSDDSGKIQIFNLRLHHVFGERDNPTKFLPNATRILMQNEVLKMTSGTQKLDFIYVKEVAALYGFLLNRAEQFTQPFEEFELGMGQQRTLKDVIEYIKSELSSTSAIEYGAIQERKNEITSAQADISKVLEAGYTYSTTVEEGLRALCTEIQSTQ